MKKIHYDVGVTRHDYGNFLPDSIRVVRNWGGSLFGFVRERLPMPFPALLHLATRTAPKQPNFPEPAAMRPLSLLHFLCHAYDGVPSVQEVLMQQSGKKQRGL